MKPTRVDMEGVHDVNELIERILRTRWREASDLAGALERRSAQELHGFRIACKRFRYAIERFESLEPALEPIAEQLAQLQDALGDAHDRDVLLTILPPPMARAQRRLRSEREECVDRAAGLWDKVRELARACPLIVLE